MTSFFQKSTSPSLVAIFQYHQRLKFTFHTLYVILELVSSTLIFWTELSCWRKCSLNKVTMLLFWSHRYTNFTVVITILMTITKYPYFKWQWIFYFLRRCFLSSVTDKTFPGLDCRDCHFFIGPSVFSNVYLQFLWIVIFWLALRYSLTFICQFL